VDVAQWYSVCLAYIRPCLQFLVLEGGQKGTVQKTLVCMYGIRISSYSDDKGNTNAMQTNKTTMGQVSSTLIVMIMT
jgi:hypothetical protein